MSRNDTSQHSPAASNTYPTVNSQVNNDEIDLLDLMRSIWSQRGLVIGCMLIAVLAVLSFHFSKATFSVASRIDYPVSLSFIGGDSELVYPNGTGFSSRDLVSNAVLLEAIKQTGLELSLTKLQGALHVHQSNSLLGKAEAELTTVLTNAKTPENIQTAAQKSLKELRDLGLGYVTLSIDLTKVSLNEQQGAVLLTNIVDAWAKQSINRGLMDMTITRPMVAFAAINGGNVIDNYDRASSYLDSLQVAATQLSELSGLNSLVVNGMTIEDIQRRLNALGTRDINPLRGFAYTNSDILSKSDAAIQVRLFSRQRLLNLEYERLTKLIESYDLALDQLGSNTPQQQIGATASRGQKSQGSQGNADRKSVV